MSEIIDRFNSLLNALRAALPDIALFVRQSGRIVSCGTYHAEELAQDMQLVLPKSTASSFLDG